jgi:hypothetical protein
MKAEATVAAFAGFGRIMSSIESKYPRRAIHYPAYVDLGPDLPLRACTLCSISEAGAELTVTNPNTLPKYFILALSIDGAAQRRCHVVWKAESQVGVEFLRTPAQNRRNAPPHPAHRDRPVEGGTPTPLDDDAPAVAGSAGALPQTSPTEA